MAESILYNANIITLDAAMPKAQMVFAKDGVIQAVCNENRVGEYRSKDTVCIDCRGKTLLPGFIDPHIHFRGFANSLMSLDLSPRNQVRSISDIQAKLRKQIPATASHAWIRAKGYDEFHLHEKRHPNRWDLDRAVSSHPVKLTHRSGHAHVLNSSALQLTGITKTTPDPPGGMIERDIDTGEPTGLLYEMGDFLAKRIPTPDAEQLEGAVKRADRKLLALGVTSIQDASARNNLDHWHAFEAWAAGGAITTRLTMMIGLEAFSKVGIPPFASSMDKDRFQLGGVKIILDETTGELHPPQELLNEVVLDIHRSGQQAIIHAIEENAIASACSAIEYALGKYPKVDHRHRIEHCSPCPPTLAERLASAGVYVVTQPAFVYFNGDRYLKTVPPKQLKYLYPFNSLIGSGIVVAAGSDCPIVPPDPFAGIYAAVSRQSETGDSVGKDEKVSIRDALEMMTLRAAQACRQETIKGSIASGKVADLILVSGDPMKVAVDEIRDLKVEMTFIAGELVWEN